MSDRLSVVVPMYNEAEVVEHFCRRLAEVLSELDMAAEVIIVDDGSSDETWSLIQRMTEAHSGFRGLRLSRNFGHQQALLAGLGAATGDAVVMMDGDLQHPPELIRALVRQWRAGHQVVNTIRTATSSISPVKNWLSEAFYHTLNRLSEVQMVPNAADFRLLDRAAADALLSLPERTAFLRGLTGWIGFSQTWVPFEAPPRYAGQTKYSLGRMIKFALSGLLSLSTRPLRVGVWSGLLLFALSWVYGLWAVWAKFVAQQAVPGWASIIWLILLAGSIQLIVLGIIAEYIGNIYEEVKGRPPYLVRETTGSVGQSTGSDEAGC